MSTTPPSSPTKPSVLSTFYSNVKQPLSKTRLVANIMSIILGALLLILVIGLSLSTLGLNPVLLCFIAVTGTALLVAGAVALQARAHLKSLVKESN